MRGVDVRVSSGVVFRGSDVSTLVYPVCGRVLNVLGGDSVDVREVALRTCAGGSPPLRVLARDVDVGQPA